MGTKRSSDQPSFAMILEQLEDEGSLARAMDHWEAALSANWPIEGSDGQSRGSMRAAIAGYLDEGNAAAPNYDWSSPEAIARELSLSGDLDSEAIKRIRRAFARLNHPDLMPDGVRDAATVRMQIANLLIDEALRLRPKRPLSD